MSKTKTPSTPSWIRNLRSLMDQHGLNPRSLSLKAGLNATAVRDMFEGRSRFPRYDTAKALAEALETTPAILMSDKDVAASIAAEGPDFGQDIALLTEIIARLQEASIDLDRNLPPRDFAAMAATIFQRMQDSADRKKKGAIGSQVHDLIDYDMLRSKRKRS